MKKIKDIIINEQNDLISKNDSSIRQKLDFNNFKRQYYYYYSILQKISTELVKFTNNLYQGHNLSLLSRYHLQNVEIPDEYFISSMNKLLNYLNDTDFKRVFEYMIKNKVIKITDNGTSISKYVYGRCIKTNEGITLMSFYKKNSFDDFQTFAHECGHTIADILFKDKINPLFKVLYRETEAMYFELLMIYFMSRNTNLKEISTYLDANLTAKIIDYVWHIRVQELLYHQFGRKINLSRLNKQFINTGGFPLTNEDIDSIMSLSLINCYNIVNSYIIALQLFQETIKDLEKGIDTYKRMLTDKETTLESLLDKYSIDFSRQKELINQKYNEAVILKKSI